MHLIQAPNWPVRNVCRRRRANIDVMKWVANIFSVHRYKKQKTENLQDENLIKI